MKKIALLMMSLILVCALAACSGDNNSQPANNNQPQQGANAETGANWQVVADLETDSSHADGVELNIPEFTADPENAVLAAANADVQAKMADWLAELDEEDYYYLLVKAYVLDTENYLSVLLTKFIAPDYGHDDEVYTYVYDKITGNLMDMDYALAWKAVTDETVAEALVNYLQPDQRWRSFTYDGFYVDTDEIPVYVIMTRVRQEGADDWTYAYLMKDGQILGNVFSVMPKSDGDAA